MNPSLDQELLQAIQGGTPVAFTALVETRGSTPQKAGAMMLVFADGSQVGTLGGGCVEAEVKSRAIRLLDQRQRELLSFSLNDNYGWDDGLICGGKMVMLVDPVHPEEDQSYYARLAELIAQGTPCSEAVLLQDDPSGAKAGDRYLLSVTGEVLASRATVPAPSSVLENLRDVNQRPRPYVQGGVSYLPRLRRSRLLIVGAGHVGQKVAELAAQVGFDVWVVDDREEFCNSSRFPEAKRLIVGPIDSSLSGLEIDDQTYCLIVTRGHHHDEEALYHLAETSARYVGMIGSRRKIKLIFTDLLAEGISREALARVHAPLGLEIGSQTVPEIAISIVAELIAERNLGESPSRYRHVSVLEES
ncbi:MAG: XdhC family protein [Planctomycetales bacterium]